MFWVDLPTAKEREEIYRIHLSKRGRDPEKYNIQEMASSSEGFSGSEIEQSIMDALTARYAADRGKNDIDSQDVIDAIKNTKPLSVLRHDVFTKMRNWAKEHARFASSAEAEELAPPSLKVVKM